jgi:hypothetical protein
MRLMLYFKRYSALFLTFFFLCYGNGYLDAQCAMCKQAAESTMDANPDSLARNLNSGILYLMATPYLLIGFIFRKQIMSGIRSLRKRKSKSID